MSFWHKNQSDYEHMQRILEQNPGMNATHLAKQLGVAPSTVQRRLPAMEEAGYLLYEDDKGGLWSFGKKR